MLLAGPISRTGIECMDFVETFNIALDISTIYFADCSGCRASFVYSCQFILECYDLFSGVKLRSFRFTPVCLYGIRSIQYSNAWIWNDFHVHIRN